MKLSKPSKIFLKRARGLRQEPTDTESFLWRKLRAKRLKDLKFRRQQPMGPYIVDFVCFEKKLIIEVDGGQHACNLKKDMKRDEWLRGRGFRVIRFWDNDVLTNIDGVLENVLDSCFPHPPLTPPVIEGGG